MKKVLVLDFGGQYNLLVARRVRECGVYCEIKSYRLSMADIRAFGPDALILTGGPATVFEPNAPMVDRALFEMGIPVLGICYGQQLMMQLLGGQCRKAETREYGKIQLTHTASPLFAGVPETSVCWMSHGVEVERIAPGFKVIATTDGCGFAAVENAEQKLYGVQFHPEVVHTEYGRQILENFLYKICGFRPEWTMASYLDEAVAECRRQIGDGRVLLALSGGVDSSVLAALLAEAIGDRLTCVFVDHGLMRKKEGDEVENAFRKWDVKFVRVDAEERFLSKLAGVEDPQRKRQIIGAEFGYVFRDEAERFGITNEDFLAQGTIYPDVIESGKGDADVIKSHHNRLLPPEVVARFKGVLEPLDLLFKDEVRALGRELGLPEYLVMRQPFPGPGLAIRIIGAVTKEKADLLREADYIFREEIAKAGEDKNLSQYFAVLTNSRSVGVMGDGRTYDYTLALRAVTTSDFMTADWARIPYEVLDRISVRLVNEVKGINRIVYDITSKPPATIEWE